MLVTLVVGTHANLNTTPSSKYTTVYPHYRSVVHYPGPEESNQTLIETADTSWHVQHVRTYCKTSKQGTDEKSLKYTVSETNS